MLMKNCGFLLHKAEDIEMLVTAVHHLARLGREQRVEIVATALNAALEDAAGVGRSSARHVVRAHVDAGVRRTQARAFGSNPSIVRPRRASSDETLPPITVLRRPVVPDRLPGLSRPIRVTTPYIAGKDDALLL